MANEVERRLNYAIANNLDPEKVSPSRTWFAWYPVHGWIAEERRHGWMWLRRVNCFCPLGLMWEYSSVG